MVPCAASAGCSQLPELLTGTHREPGRGLEALGGLERRSSVLETLPTPRALGDDASPVGQVQRAEEVTPRGPRASAAAALLRAGLKPLGTPGLCCCAGHRRCHRRLRAPRGGAAREGRGEPEGGHRRFPGCGMEPRAAKAGEPEPAASPSFQARLWKNLQLGVGKGKGGGGCRTGGPERRTAATPTPSPPPPRATQDGLAGVGSTGSRWSGFKKRKQVLDRVFSSSQPNLCCSSPEALETIGAGKAEQGSTLRHRLREHLLPVAKGPATAAGPTGVTPPGGHSPDSVPSSSASSSLSSSPQPPARGNRVRDEGARRGGSGVHLCHQKSSSLPGTACLEQLLQPVPPPVEAARGPAEPQALLKDEERSQVSARSDHGTSCLRATSPASDCPSLKRVPACARMWETQQEKHFTPV